MPPRKGKHHWDDWDEEWEDEPERRGRKKLRPARRRVGGWDDEEEDLELEADDYDFDEG